MRVVKKGTPDERSGLVLTRRLGESILVEHGILEIKIVQLNNRHVRLKFYGNVKIDRKERVEKGEK